MGIFLFRRILCSFNLLVVIKNVESSSTSSSLLPGWPIFFFTTSLTYYSQTDGDIPISISVTRNICVLTYSDESLVRKDSCWAAIRAYPAYVSFKKDMRSITSQRKWYSQRKKMFYDLQDTHYKIVWQFLQIWTLNILKFY